MRMTVKQLKSALEHYPEDALILVEGYEGGFSDIGLIKETRVQLDLNNEDWLGPHDEAAGATTPAIFMLRAPNSSAVI